MDPLNPGINPEEHRHWREMLGAFVLGRLDEGERVALQAHTSTAAPSAGPRSRSCGRSRRSGGGRPRAPRGRRSSAGEPDRRDPRAGRTGAPAPPPAAEAPAVRKGGPGRGGGAVRRHRLLRAPPLISPGPPLEPVAFSEVAAGVEAGLISPTRGIETRLVASRLPDGRTYGVTLVSGDGTLVPSGAFSGTADSPVECNLNAPLLRQDVAGLKVRSANVELMLYAELPEDAPSAERSPSLAALLSQEDPRLRGTPRKRAHPGQRSPQRRGGTGEGRLPGRGRPREGIARGRQRSSKRFAQKLNLSANAISDQQEHISRMLTAWFAGGRSFHKPLQSGPPGGEEQVLLVVLSTRRPAAASTPPVRSSGSGKRSPRRRRR